MASHIWSLCPSGLKKIEELLSFFLPGTRKLTVIDLVYQKPLALFSQKPMTGFYRDGYCRVGPEDGGNHAVAGPFPIHYHFTPKRKTMIESPEIKPFPTPRRNFPPFTVPPTLIVTSPSSFPSIYIPQSLTPIIQTPYRPPHQRIPRLLRFAGQQPAVHWSRTGLQMVSLHRALERSHGRRQVRQRSRRPESVLTCDRQIRGGEWGGGVERFEAVCGRGGGVGGWGQFGGECGEESGCGGWFGEGDALKGER